MNSRSRGYEPRGDDRTPLLRVVYPGRSRNAAPQGFEPQLPESESGVLPVTPWGKAGDGRSDWRRRCALRPLIPTNNPLFLVPRRITGPRVNSLSQRNRRADDGDRTRDLHLGKVTRYQLRYIRKCVPDGHTLYPWRDSNPQPLGSEPSASTSWATRARAAGWAAGVVPARGFEPPTTRPSSVPLCQIGVHRRWQSRPDSNRRYRLERAAS